MLFMYSTFVQHVVTLGWWGQVQVSGCLLAFPLPPLAGVSCDIIATHVRYITIQICKQKQLTRCHLLLS